MNTLPDTPVSATAPPAAIDAPAAAPDATGAVADAASKTARPEGPLPVVKAARKTPVRRQDQVKPTAAVVSQPAKAATLPRRRAPAKSAVAAPATATKAAKARTVPSALPVNPSPKSVKTTVAAKHPAHAKAPRVKDKLVRDSFTMPSADFALIQQLKDRALGFKRATKKSELLRAGLQALAAMDEASLKALLDQLPALKAGRPSKHA